MGMNVIQPVTILDGNQYLVQGPADKTGQATDRKSTRLNSSHNNQSRMPSSA